MIIRKRKKKKKNRKRIDPRFLIIIGVLLAVIAALLIILLYNGREELTERGTAIMTMEKVSAVIIRDEEVYSSPEYARIDCLKEEGAPAEEGDKLATVYKLGYSDELMQSLLQSREDVYKAQMERIGSTRDSRHEEMNAEIADLKSRIAASVMQDSGEDLLSLYKQLDSVLKDRMEYLRGKVQETETLRALYSAVEGKETLISTWTEDVVADKPGVVSYYFDGYEQAINAEKLNMLSGDLIKRAINDSGSATWTTDDHTKACRVVNGNKWYVAFTTGSESLKRLAQGVEYEVEITGYGTHKGVALEPIMSGKQVVNLIEFSDFIGDLINVRTAKVTVTAPVSGIRVKSRAIRFEGGNAYLEIMLSDSHYTIRVDVLAEEEDTVIVRPHESGDVLNEGVRYWSKKR